MFAHRVAKDGAVEIRTSSGWLCLGYVERSEVGFRVVWGNGSKGETFLLRRDAVSALLEAWSVS